MNCPKCGGGAYLSEEELVKVVENTDPVKIIAKAVYVCRSCGERFSRLVCEDIEARKKTESPSASMPMGFEKISQPAREPAEGLRFLDDV